MVLSTSQLGEFEMYIILLHWLTVDTDVSYLALVLLPLFRTNLAELLSRVCTFLR